MFHCKQLMETVEKLVPNCYKYQTVRDPKTSGRFEVTVYKTADDLEKNKNGTLLHSKKDTGKFPKDDEEFNAKVKQHATP